MSYQPSYILPSYGQQADDLKGSNASSAPAHAPEDMPNGLETGSCAMARAFYETYGEEASHYIDRVELGRFFAEKQDELLAQREDLRTLCTQNGREDPRRHWRQVLFALSRDGRVLRVTNGGKSIQWNFVA